MTALQEMYRELRDAGCGHRAALDRLVVKLDIDRASLARVLARAESGRGKAAYARFRP